MFSRGFFACVLMCVTALWLGFLASAAEPKEEAKLQAKIKQLVEQLADPAKRTAAETELLKMGPEILSLLPTDDAKFAPEQKERLKVIRQTLLESQALKETAGRTVTLQNKSITLSKALDEINKQTAMQVADRRRAKGDDPSLKLDLQKVSFWEALDAVAREADLQVSPYEKDGKVALRDGPHRSPPVSYHGMFRTTVKRITTVRDLESEAHLCTVHLEVAWEPRFQPLFLNSKPDVLDVRDDKGIALKVPEGGSTKLPVSGRMTTEIPVTAEAPQRVVGKIGLLKGKFSMVGPGKMLDFTFDKLASAEKQSRDGVTVRIREFKTDAEQWKVSLSLEYPPGGQDFESFESWLVNNEIFLENKAGKRFGHGGYEVEEQTGSKAIINYLFVEENDLVLGKPEDWKLIYRTPGVIVKVPISFEFKDLPLP